MNPPRNPPYKGFLVDVARLDAPGKIYYADIRGRNPEKYEWGHCGLDKAAVRRNVEHFARFDKIPLIAVAFPHVTPVYLWGNPLSGQKETNLYRTGFYTTADFTKHLLKGGDVEMCCPVEAYVMAEEMKLWAAAATVREYLERTVALGPVVDVVNPNKLLEAMLAPEQRA